MVQFHLSRSSWVLALMLGLWAVVAQAQEYRYHYVSFSEVELPPGFTRFVPGAIQDSGRVYGTLVCGTPDNVSCGDSHIAFYKDGTFTIQAAGFAAVVNAGGTVGGGFVVNPQNFITQAALFRGDEVELIPPQPGETDFFFLALTDPGTALIRSFTDSRSTYVLYSKGQATSIDFGPKITRPVLRSNPIGGAGRFINNAGVLAGITIPPEGSLFNGARGFRFDPRTGETVILEPVPPDNLAWGMGINNRGDVLGYSFTSGVTPYHEGIGVWDRKGQFTTYFSVSDEPVSNYLLFNDNNLIVITSIRSTNTSYLVPKPGVRLDLGDLVENLPPGRKLQYVTGLNNHGDIIGKDDKGFYFLLERIGGE